MKSMGQLVKFNAFQKTKQQARVLPNIPEKSIIEKEPKMRASTLPGSATEMRKNRGMTRLVCWGYQASRYRRNQNKCKFYPLMIARAGDIVNYQNYLRRIGCPVHL
jgi:hypothetical protein